MTDADEFNSNFGKIFARSHADVALFCSRLISSIVLLSSSLHSLHSFSGFLSGLMDPRLHHHHFAAAAAAAAAAAQAQYQMDQKKGPAAVAPSAGMPQGDKSVEENGSGVVADQATRKPMPGQVKAHQPLHKDNSGE